MVEDGKAKPLGAKEAAELFLTGESVRLEDGESGQKPVFTATTQESALAQKPALTQKPTTAPIKKKS